MEVKKDILWRVYLCFLGMALFGIIIIGKVFIIQRVEGKYWRSMADSLHTRYITTDAQRGTIYSAEGRMLSTSVPYFDIRLDMEADGLREKQGKIFRENVDSLSISLSALFKDKTSRQYKRILEKAYNDKERYFLLKRNVTFEDYQRLQQLPMFRLGRNKGGMIGEEHDKRINPFRLLANRSIGLWRENAQNVGLEATYDSLLKGVSGKRLVRRISGGVYVPVDGYDIDPENGKDIITNIDVNIQDIAENALYDMVSGNEASHGTCIVMEVKSGKIRAIANLGRQPDGSYWEDYNYALMTTEPGSTFKLATLIAVLEDHLVTPNSMVDLNYGTWKFGKRTVYDSEHHGKTWVTVKEAFELSSNVGFSQLAYLYKDNPMAFIRHLYKLKLNQRSGIDLAGEGAPVINTPSSRTWSATTLPWMGFGYEVLVSPLQVLTLYNAVANDGKMMKPYLVNSVEEYGHPVKTFHPTVVEKICADTILHQLKGILEGVVQEGTAKTVFKNAPYTAAGKTGTALVANGRHGYADKIYQSTFVGYFPADHPVYSCIVVIKNKPHAAKYYGASVAGPVFREVADKLYAMYIHPPSQTPLSPAPQFDSLLLVKNGNNRDLKIVLGKLGITFSDSSRTVWAQASTTSTAVKLQPVQQEPGEVPDVSGMGLKDALYLLENTGMKVTIRGSGKVIAQSIPAGSRLQQGQDITIELN